MPLGPTGYCGVLWSAPACWDASALAVQAEDVARSAADGDNAGADAAAVIAGAAVGCGVPVSRAPGGIALEHTGVLGVRFVCACPQD
jgi:hypothetical protein